MMFNWLSIIAGVFYVILGVVVIVYKFFAIPLEANMAYLLGGLLIIYGIFRVVRSIKKFKNVEDEE